MTKKFKTLITSTGEYGVIDTNIFDEIFVGTSSTPTLYGIDTTIEGLDNYFGNYIFEETEDNFSWNEHVPSDWKLIDIEIIHE